MPRVSSIDHATPVRHATGPIAPVVGDWAIMETRFESPHTQVARCVPVQRELADGDEYLIKMPRWDAQSSETARHIIRREAELLNGLDHPHLISVLDADLQHSLPFFIMPNVGHRTLRDWIGEPGSTSIHDALWYVRQTAGALSYLHANGWSHLDIKPENIVVNELGHVTVIDLAFATSFRTHSKDRLPLTGTGQYIAPERRVRGWSVSPAADVYSLGQVLLELLLGAPDSNSKRASDACEAREGLLVSATSRRRAERFQLLRSFYPSLPADFAETVERMTAAIPERRPTIEELVDCFIRWEILLWQP